MSILEKLTTIAENEQKVYQAGQDYGFYRGYQNGIESGKEVGRQAERDEFWEVFQNYGSRNQYAYAFYMWSNAIYDPKYKIIINSGSSTYQNAAIVDTKVDIDVSKGTNSTYLFNTASKLETIRKLIVSENNVYTGWFSSCSKLENLTIEGVIGKSINFSPSPLTAESAISVIEHLKDFSGTSNEYTCTVTFSSTTKANLNALGNTAPNGMTWLDYATYGLGWNV